MPKLVRDVALFVTGLALIVNEARRPEEPRFYLLVLYAAMVGLPAFLTTDTMSSIERFLRGRHGGEESGGPDTPEPPKPPRPPRNRPLTCWSLAS